MTAFIVNGRGYNTANHQKTFFKLIRLGIGHRADSITEEIDWKGIQTLAEIQGLSAIVADGVEKLPESLRPQKDELLQWLGEVVKGYEARYELSLKEMADLAAFYNRHGYKMMVLKGYACSLDWPRPEHRPCGDIDIWLFGQQKKADKTLAKEKGIRIDNSHCHHTVFKWGDFTVENHYGLVNVHAHRPDKELGIVFKELGQDDTHHVDLLGEAVYLPSPNLRALFQYCQMVSQFIGAKITLRQVLDWAFFVEKHTIEIEWEWLTTLLEKYHMMDFFNCINAICVEDLGFSLSCFPSI